jgi:hypothetical protein
MIYVKKFSSESEGCRIVTICYRVHLLSATAKEGGVSRQFNEKICSDRVGLYFLPARSKKAASAINSTKKSAQIGSGFTSILQGQRKRRQPSIQQRDLLSSGRVHLQPATVKVGGVSHQFNKKICSARVGFAYSLQRSKKWRQPWGYPMGCFRGTQLDTLSAGDTIIGMYLIGACISSGVHLRGVNLMGGRISQGVRISWACFFRGPASQKPASN